MAATSPFIRQCFVTSGVFLNVVNSGLVMEIATILLPQSRRPNFVPWISRSSTYWIVTLPAIAAVVGGLLAAPLMDSFGRKIVNLISLCVSIIASLNALLSHSLSVIFLERFLNGISVGMILAVGPVLIGEYTSPKNRGAFLTTIAIALTIGTLYTYSIGYCYNWQISSIISIGIAVLSLVIVILSPESPTFLASRGKYDECRKAFKYLRGDSEDDELEKMIAANKILRKENENLETRGTCGAKLGHLIATIRQKQFYKPILITVHLFVMAQSAISVLTSDPSMLIVKMVGYRVDTDSMVPILQLNRLVAGVLSMIVIKRTQRRKFLFVVVPLNIAINLAIIVYSVIKVNYYIGHINPTISLTLIHIQMFVATIGAVPLSYILAGELYPMEHKGVCAGISTVFLHVSTYLGDKAVLLWFNILNVYGLYLTSSVIICYCMLFVCLTLPETKDKTLQDVEEEFKEKKEIQTLPVLEVNKRNKLDVVA